LYEEESNFEVKVLYLSFCTKTRFPAVASESWGDTKKERKEPAWLSRYFTSLNGKRCY